MQILIERRAEIALRSLRGRDKKQIQRALEDIQELTPDTIFHHHKIHRFAASLRDPLYVYGGVMRLRLILKITGDVCEVIDIVDHDRLNRLLDGRGQR